MSNELEFVCKCQIIFYCHFHELMDQLAISGNYHFADFRATLRAI